MHNILWPRNKTNGCFSDCLSMGNSAGHRCPTRGLSKSRKLGKELRLERDMPLFVHFQAESVSVLLHLVILFWIPAEMVKEQDNK